MSWEQQKRHTEWKMWSHLFIFVVLFFCLVFCICLCVHHTGKNISPSKKSAPDSTPPSYQIICTVVVDVMLLILLTSIRRFDVGFYWTWCIFYCTLTAFVYSTVVVYRQIKIAMNLPISKTNNAPLHKQFQMNYFSIFTCATCIYVFLSHSSHENR